jgi:hypothetical protein
MCRHHLLETGFLLAHDLPWQQTRNPVSILTLMRRWTRRAGYLLIILLWLILVSFPVVAFFLATQGQIQIGDSDSGLRLFLLQERDTQGLGLQWSRFYDNGEPSSAGQPPGECTRTTLRYFLWEGDAAGQNLDYCQCRDRQTQEALPVGTCTLE